MNDVCGRLKREDSQRIWIFTNDFNGPSEKDEHERIVQRIAVKIKMGF